MGGVVPKHLNNGPEVAESPRGGYARRLCMVAFGSGLLALACVAVAGFVHGPFSTGGRFNPYWLVFFWAVFFVAGALYACRKWFAAKPENIYLIVVLAATFTFSFSISVRAVGWDTGVHYRNMMCFASLGGEVDVTESDDEMMAASPLEYAEDTELVELNERTSDLDARDGSPIRSFGAPKAPVWYVTGVEYIPYALAERLCDLLHVPFTWVLVLLNMIGALFYSIVTYFGMTKLRWGKMLYAVIALLPTSIFLASSLGYSYWLFSLCLYGFASLVGMLQGSQVATTSSLAKMLVALLAGMLPRVVYFPLLFLCLLIPTERFASKRLAHVYRMLLVGSALLAFGVWLVPKLLSGSLGGDSRGGGNVDAGKQLAYVLSHPLEFASTLASFLSPPLRMEGGAADVEGVNMVSGYLSVEASTGILTNYGYLPRVHWAFATAIWVLIAFTTLTNKPRMAGYGAMPGFVSFVLCALVLVMIVTAMYLDFTPVGLPEIHGVQRRYIIPLLYPLLAFVGPRVLGLDGRLAQRGTAVYNAFVLVGMTTVLFASWWTSTLVTLV